MSRSSLDLAGELLSFADAAKIVPPNGVNPMTIFRWARHGLRGRKLQSMIIAGKGVTTKESLFEFLTAVSHERLNTPTKPPAKSKKRSQSRKRAKRVLNRAKV